MMMMMMMIWNGDLKLKFYIFMMYAFVSIGASGPLFDVI